MHHKLTGANLCDLLELIELHCPSPNNCKTTMRGLREYLAQAQQPAEFHKYFTTAAVNRHIRDAVMSYLSY